MFSPKNSSTTLVSGASSASLMATTKESTAIDIDDGSSSRKTATTSITGGVSSLLNQLGSRNDHLIRGQQRALEPTNPNGEYAVIGKTRLKKPFKLYYEVHGQGPIKILFIMGLNVTLHGWDNQYSYFGSHGEYTCVVFDNRGVGFSDCPPGRYTTSDMAKDTYELLLWLGWKENVHVVGVSMGGMIAEELCILSPESIASLTLTSTHAGLALPPPQALFFVPKVLMMADPVAKLEVIRDILFPTEWLDAESKQHKGKTNREVETENLVSRALLTPPPNIYGALSQILAVTSHFVSPNRLKTIAEAKYPVFVVTGTIDNLVHPSNSEYLAKILNAEKYHVFHGRGHALPSEIPEEYNAMLKEFIDEAQRKLDSSGCLKL